MDKITITSGDYNLMCVKIQFLEKENNKLKGYIEELKEQLSELLPSTCPSCGSYEWSYHLSIDKMKCLDCGNCF
jgi:ferredoxin-like protein FixX